MSGKISKSGFAKNVRPDGAKEAEHRKTATSLHESSPQQAADHRRRRAKSSEETTQLLVRPSVRNVKRLRQYALDHEASLSAVVDLLLERYLDDLEL